MQPRRDIFRQLRPLAAASPAGFLRGDFVI
jgi:hypothetical protein